MLTAAVDHPRRAGPSARRRPRGPPPADGRPGGVRSVPLPDRPRPGFAGPGGGRRSRVYAAERLYREALKRKEDAVGPHRRRPDARTTRPAVPGLGRPRSGRGAFPARPRPCRAIGQRRAAPLRCSITSAELWSARPADHGGAVVDRMHPAGGAGEMGHPRSVRTEGPVQNLLEIGNGDEAETECRIALEVFEREGFQEGLAHVLRVQAELRLRSGGSERPSICCAGRPTCSRERRSWPNWRGPAQWAVQRGVEADFLVSETYARALEVARRPPRRRGRDRRDRAEFAPRTYLKRQGCAGPVPGATRSTARSSTAPSSWPT